MICYILLDMNVNLIIIALTTSQNIMLRSEIKLFKVTNQQSRDPYNHKVPLKVYSFGGSYKRMRPIISNVCCQMSTKMNSFIKSTMHVTQN